MSALDQAFIRAYRHQDVSHGAQPVTPISADQIWPDEAATGASVCCSPVAEHEVAMPIEMAMVSSASTFDIVDDAEPAFEVEPALAVAEPPVATQPPEVMEPTRLTDTTAPPEFSAPPKTAAPPAPPSSSEGRPFRPMLQVDSLVWPKVCSQMSIEAGDELNRLADGFVNGITDGCKVVTFGGCVPSEGSTTLLLGIARRLSERGINLAIVDADLADPLLCRRMGMLPEAGWEEVAADRMPLAEAVVESIEDHLTLLPLCKPRDSQGEDAATLASLTPSIARLREHCDLVLVDVGPLELKQEADLAAIAAWTDAVVLVCDVRTTPSEQVIEARSRLRSAGVDRVGIAENFVPV